jgi:hypothetical protein
MLPGRDCAVRNPEAVSQVSRSASGVTRCVMQKADKSVSGFFLRMAQSGTRPTTIEHSATCETTSPFLTELRLSRDKSGRVERVPPYGLMSKPYRHESICHQKQLVGQPQDS